jgi:hypothetical protein
LNGGFLRRMSSTRPAPSKIAQSVVSAGAMSLTLVCVWRTVAAKPSSSADQPFGCGTIRI